MEQSNGESSFNFFRKLDYFGVAQTFRVNSEDKYTSVFGGITFICYLIFAIVYFFHSFSAYVNKEIKTVMTSEEILVPAPELNFHKLSYNLGFGLVFDSNSSIAFDLLSQYIDVTLNLVKQFQNGTKVKSKIILEKCIANNFPYVNSSQFNAQGLYDYLCIKNTSNISMLGIYSDKLFQYLEYTIALKSSVLFDNTTFLKLDQLMMDYPLKINTFFVDISLDVNNLTSTSSLFLNSVTNYLLMSSYQKQNLDFVLLNFTDDSSIISYEPKTSPYIKFLQQMTYSMSIQNRLKTSNSDKLNIYRIYIRANQHVSFLTRSFQKLPQYIANVSGILSNVLVFILILCRIINEFKLKQSLINKIFNFRDHMATKTNIMEKLNLILEDCDYTQTAPSSSSRILASKRRSSYLKAPNKPFDKSLLDKLPPKKFDFDYCLKREIQSKTFLNFASKSKPLEFNLYEMISSLFCCSPNHLKFRKQIYNRGKEKLFYYLDILTLIKKFQEFDIVKSLIFNKDQINILNFLSKPIVSIAQDSNLTRKNSQLFQNDFEDDDYSKLVLRDSQINDGEIENLYLSYQNLKESKNCETESPETKKLLERLEKKLRVMF
jgi:hypothetical protein